MKQRIWLISVMVLLAAVVVLAQSQPNASSTTETKNTTSHKAHKRGEAKTADVPVDIDITDDGHGNPTAQDATVHRSKHEVARWNNKMGSNCDVSFSPFAKSNYHVLKGGHQTSGPILAPDGTYNYWISCGTKSKKSKPADPAIIVTN